MRLDVLPVLLLQQPQPLDVGARHLLDVEALVLGGLYPGPALAAAVAQRAEDEVGPVQHVLPHVVAGAEAGEDPVVDQVHRLPPDPRLRAPASPTAARPAGRRGWFVHLSLGGGGRGCGGRGAGRRRGHRIDAWWRGSWARRVDLWRRPKDRRPRDGLIDLALRGLGVLGWRARGSVRGGGSLDCSVVRIFPVLQVQIVLS